MAGLPQRIAQDLFFIDDAPPVLLSSFSLSTVMSSHSDRGEIREYRVKPGDTLSKIAQSFSIDINTILAVNEIDNPENLKPGTILTILPTKGTLHLIQEGEDLQSIAEKYKVDIQDIRAWNLQSSYVAGELIIVPGAKLNLYRPNLSSKAVAKSFFLCPLVGSCNLTQGLHFFNAVDISHGKCGEPIIAAATGSVKKVGYSRLGGNYVLISHGNGVSTFYAHMQKAIVRIGQKVKQGEVIGYVGNTGFTLGPTGCHVHFEVRGAKNPFAY